jgi:hypothetical protein
MSGYIIFEDQKNGEMDRIDLNLLDPISALPIIMKMTKKLKGSWKMKEMKGEGPLWDYLREQLKEQKKKNETK